MNDFEHIDGRGDLWRVRECDDEDGCVVLERFVANRPPSTDPHIVGLLKAAAEAEGQEFHPDGLPDDEPTDCVHVPADVWRLMCSGGL